MKTCQLIRTVIQNKNCITWSNSIMVLVCLSFNAFSQNPPNIMTCKKDSISQYKYGFSNHKNGYKSYTKITPSIFSGWRRIISYNQTLPELYSIALGAGNTFPSNRILIEVSEPEKLQSMYCYELNVPPYLTDNMFVIMQQNLRYQYPDYIASLIYINGQNWLKITDKEEGIILNPVTKNNTY